MLGAVRSRAVAHSNVNLQQSFISTLFEQALAGPWHASIAYLLPSEAFPGRRPGEARQRAQRSGATLAPRRQAQEQNAQEMMRQRQNREGGLLLSSCFPGLDACHLHFVRLQRWRYKSIPVTSPCWKFVAQVFESACQRRFESDGASRRPEARGGAVVLIPRAFSVWRPLQSDLGTEDKCKQ